MKTKYRRLKKQNGGQRSWKKEIGYNDIRALCPKTNKQTKSQIGFVALFYDITNRTQQLY